MLRSNKKTNYRYGYITPGAVIVMRKTAPMGDPIEINVRGYELSIRKSEAQDIRIEVEG